jgi:hypothetical protein
VTWEQSEFKLPDRHNLSEATRAIEAANARYHELARRGVALFQTRAPEAERAANRAEQEAAKAEWLRLIAGRREA